MANRHNFKLNYSSKVDIKVLKIHITTNILLLFTINTIIKYKIFLLIFFIQTKENQYNKEYQQQHINKNDQQDQLTKEDICRCVSLHQVTSLLGAVLILRKPFVLAMNHLTHIYSQLVWSTLATYQ